MITDLSLSYLYRKPATAATPPKLLLLLHGFGSHAQDLFALADSFPETTGVVCPQAPYPLFTDSFAWYHIDFQGNDKFIDSQQAQKSLQVLQQFIEALKARYQINAADCYLGGFSQGAIMSYAMALNFPTKIGGVMAMSGYVLKDLIPPKIDKSALQKLKIIGIHGSEDLVIPQKMGQMGYEYMQSLGANIQYKTYKMPHTISPEALSDLVAWFKVAAP